MLRYKYFSFWAYLFALCFCCCVAIFLYSWIAATEQEDLMCRISFDARFSMAIIGRWGESLIVFNQRDPYLGGFYGVTGGSKIQVTRLDYYGVYFRKIIDPSINDSWWTVMISLWYPISFFGIIVSLLLLKRLKGIRPFTKSVGNRKQGQTIDS